MKEGVNFFELPLWTGISSLIFIHHALGRYVTISCRIFGVVMEKTHTPFGVCFTCFNISKPTTPGIAASRETYCEKKTK